MTPTRPADVDTGFWLWAAALPLLMVGQFSDALTAPVPGNRIAVVTLTSVFIVVLGIVVLTFLLLLRSGYRWTRTMLTAGGVATIVYTAISLLGVAREPVPALVFAATGIIGSVLIGGGIYLLHLPDSQQFFIK